MSIWLPKGSMSYKCNTKEKEEEIYHPLTCVASPQVKNWMIRQNHDCIIMSSNHWSSLYLKWMGMTGLGISGKMESGSFWKSRICLRTTYGGGRDCSAK